MYLILNVVYYQYWIIEEVLDWLNKFGVKKKMNGNAIWFDCVKCERKGIWGVEMRTMFLAKKKNSEFV